MAWTYTGRQANAGGSGVGSLNVTLNSTVAGNCILVGTSHWKSTGRATVVTCSDGVNGTYTSSIVAGINATGIAANFKENIAGGNITVTSDPSGGGSGDSNDMAVIVAEFAGGATASAASGTPVSATHTSGTTLSTGTMTPADNDVLLFAVIDVDAYAAITENAGGEGFTLLFEKEGTPGQPISSVYKIISGAPGTPSHSWTKSSGANAACCLIALKPAPTFIGDDEPVIYIPRMVA